MTVGQTVIVLCDRGRRMNSTLQPVAFSTNARIALHLNLSLAYILYRSYDFLYLNFVLLYGAGPLISLTTEVRILLGPHY